MEGSKSEEQKHLLQLFQNFHVHSGLSITEIREITAKVFVDLEVRSPPMHRGAHTETRRRAARAGEGAGAAWCVRAGGRGGRYRRADPERRTGLEQLGSACDLAAKGPGRG